MSGAERNMNGMDELLCAYVLGEVDDAQRAAVEAALAGSAELRAEMERIAATIGLVQEVYTEGATLPDEKLAALARAAEKGGAPAPILAFPRSPLLRAAAAVAAVAAGVVLLVQVPGGRSGDLSGDVMGDVMMARAPETPAERVLAEAEGVTARGTRLGELLAEPAPGKKAKEVYVGGLVEAEEEPAQETPAGLDPTRALELSAGELNSRLGGLESFGAKFEPTVRGIPVLGADGEAPPAGAPKWTGQRLDELQDGVVGPGPEVHRVTGGVDDFFLGHGQAPVDRLSVALPQQGDTSGAVRVVEHARVPGSVETFRVENAAQIAAGAAGTVEAYKDDYAKGVEAARENAFAKRRIPSLGTARATLEKPPSGPGSPGPSSPGPPRSQMEGKRVAVVDGPLTLGRGGLEVDKSVDHWLRDEAVGGRELRVGNKNLRYKQGLTPEQRRLWIQGECERRIVQCYRLPHERPSAMYFRFWGDNAFQLSKLDSLSTFSVDVDTASYALARRYLNDGHLPEKAQIRTEEFLNYFDPDLPAPTEGTFAVSTELAPSLFGGREDRWILRVGVRGREISRADRQPLALTFVVDTSGSMKTGQRLELVKHAIRLLVGELDARDSISIVAFSTEARQILPMTSAAQRGVIEAAIHPLAPNGNTNAEGGLKLGYEIALAALTQGSHNRVILLSDGVANVGQTDQNRISEDVKRHREQGIYLNTIGVGMSNHNDVFLEQLADKGDGICDYVDSAETAHRAIVERFAGAFQPIASDVKIQVEFDPAQVHRYRLLGYENRAIADKDFRNDAVDAGEVGSGHQVIALYELERTSAASDGPLATVRLRYKEPKVAGQDPNEVAVTELEHATLAVNALGSFDTASPGYRRSVLVAQFAEFLRRSTHALGDSYERLVRESTKLAGELADPDFTEFCTLAAKAADLIVRRNPRTELELTLDEFRRFQVLQGELDCLDRKLDDALMDELRGKNSELEDRIRDLIRKELEGQNG